MNVPLHSAKSVEWHTPAPIIEAARHALGGTIALDPASSALANQTVRAGNFYTVCGLSKPWFGPLFVNPPGKSPTNPGGQAAWWNKLMGEWVKGRNHWDAIFLGFSLELLQTAQRYHVWQPLDFMCCVPKRRIKFVDGRGGQMKSPTHGNIIVCVTISEIVRKRFREAFSSIGHISERSWNRRTP
jgi:hypothetical protein